MNPSLIYSLYKQSQERVKKGKHDQRDSALISLWDTVAELQTEKKRLDAQLDELSKDNRQYARDLDIAHSKLSIAEGKPITLGQYGTTLLQ